ncbi:MAG: hypothetical protein KF767_14415 [Bdellovibrionaceae bacterium]|nr:hypothetical protein [Pseudobdellovibrionaceae bacterium]
MKPVFARVALLSALTLLGFQNCGQNYDVASSDAASAVTPEDIEAACRAQTPKAYTLNVQFDDPGDCGWGAGRNLPLTPMGEGYVSAHREQVVIADLPTNAKVCGLKFRMDSQYMRYDDQMLLHLNGRVFAATYAPMVAMLDVDDGLRVYDWEKLRGRAADPRGYDVYCLGAREGLSSCRIPRSESTGQLELSLDQSLMYRLSAARSAGTPVQLGLVTTGDNDANDCRHSTLRFALDFTYVD